MQRCKRNYNKTKTYKSNVVPFPFVLFGRGYSIIEKIEQKNFSQNNKIPRIFFSGTIFDHIDKEMNYRRNRVDIYNKISSFIYNPGFLQYDNFLHLCTIKTPTLSAVMSEQGAADCTFKMRNGVKEMSEEKLGEIYFKQNNNREPNRGDLTIDFSKRAGTQLSMMQITAIKNEEEEKLNSTAGKSTSQIINFSEMEKKYIMPIMQYLNSVKRLKMFNERYGSKI